MNYLIATQLAFPLYVLTGSEACLTYYQMGNRALSLKVRRLEREANHLPPFSGKV
jgi:hypothetical protein